MPQVLIEFKESHLLIIQLIGYAAMAFAVFSFTRNTKTQINVCQIISGALFSVHFFLLTEMTGFILNVLGTGRAAVYANSNRGWLKNEKVNVAFLVFFMILCIVTGLLTWDTELGVIGFLPVIGMLLSTVGFWIKNPTAIRLVSLAASPCWLIYNVFVGSWPGVITEVCCEISILISIGRYDIIPLVKKTSHR